jgi:RNase P/RNase MRP subunit p29
MQACSNERHAALVAQAAANYLLFTKDVHILQLQLRSGNTSTVSGAYLVKELAAAAELRASRR